MLNEAEKLLDTNNTKTTDYLFLSLKERNNAPFRVKLVYSRLYFFNNPVAYLFLKFILGMLLFAIPIFLLFIIMKSDFENQRYNNFSLATCPILIATLLIIAYIIFLLFYKINQLFSINV
jgi:hypothetical protein